MSGNFINDPGYEVPDNKILIVPHSLDNDGHYKEVLYSLNGKAKREWFTSHFYYCLPLTIGNQYGFAIKSLRDFDMIWDGTEKDAEIEFLNNDNSEKQVIKTGFSQGIVTVQNMFSIKTPPGINIMTIQAPNFFIPGCFSMTGVVETDQIRRDFTFNFKITVPNVKIGVRKGDVIGAFIPIPRGFIDNFEVSLVSDFFDQNMHKKEIDESNMLSFERNTIDKEKPHQSGRKYFNGVHSDGTKYKDHQKRLK